MEQYRSMEHIMESRRATRQFDPNFHLTEMDIHQLLEVAVKTPSSSNLQPWKVHVVLDEAEKAKIRPIALDQPQVEEAAALVTICADVQLPKNIERVNRQLYETKSIDEETFQQKLENDRRYYATKNRQDVREIAHFDTGLFSMSIVLLAQSKGIDSCIMGGFDRHAYQQLFDLEERYEPVVMIALGKRRSSPHPTVRFPVQDILL